LPDTIVQFITDYGYLALFAGIFLDNFGVPSGSEALVFIAAGLADQGSLDLRWVIVLAAAAAIASDQVLYFLAAKGVRRLTERFVP
jgi:membrane protein DedA with SNARE-associated domain